MTVSPIVVPDDAARLAAPDRRFASFPTLTVVADPRTEDEWEWLRDVDYLADLANAIMDEYRSNTRAVTSYTARGDLAQLNARDADLAVTA